MSCKCDFYRYYGDYRWRLDYGALWCFLFRCCKKTKQYHVPYLFFRILLRLYSQIKGIEISGKCSIGEGLFMSHPWGITINSNAILGKNINIHKGVTIGQENRGIRKGTPVLGNQVWLGINSTIVGKITIGNDVLIAHNSFVNFDVPDHSIVIGNKIIPSEQATKDYINNMV